jgi:hypothetical protein
MVLFQCDKCNYTTKYKQNINNHLNKKKLCSNQIIRVNKEILELSSISPLKEVIELFEEIEDYENDKKITA